MAAEIMVSNVLWSSFIVSIINLQEDYQGDSRFINWTLFKVIETDISYNLEEKATFQDWLENSTPKFSREFKNLTPETKYIIRAEISNLSHTFRVILATGEVETDSLPPSVEDSKKLQIDGPNFQVFRDKDLDKKVSWSVTISNMKSYFSVSWTLHLGKHQLAGGEAADIPSYNWAGSKWISSSGIPSGRYKWVLQVEAKEHEYSEPIIFKKTGYFCWFGFGQIDAVWEKDKILYLNNYKDKVKCSIYPIVDRQLFFEVIKEVRDYWEDGSLDRLNYYINIEKKISKELFEYIYNEVLSVSIPEDFPFYESDTNNCFYNLQQQIKDLA